MISLWPRRHSVRSDKRSSLRLDRLETRDCPSAYMISFDVIRNQGRDIAFSGSVYAPNPSQTEVRLSGAASAIVSINAAGIYSGTATTVGFGQISATMFNLQGTPISRSLSYDFQNWAPTVGFQVQQNGPGQFGLTGNVGDEDPHLATVHISGIGSGSTTPDASGNFSYALGSVGPGIVNLQTVDSLGLWSPLVGAQAVNAAPVMISLTATNIGHVWTISGTVQDEWRQGLVVTFQSTIPSINGTTATVNSNGSFARVFYMKAGQMGGFVDANTVDWFGLGSNTLSVYVG